MTAPELQRLIEAVRAPYTPGVPMDARTDQDILVGIVDGLGGDKPCDLHSEAWKAGIIIGRKLRKALQKASK